MTEPAFVLVFFFVTLPLLNALSDWLSVSVTQWCLTQSKTANWFWWIFLDLVMALIMLTLVFLGVFLLLKAMHLVGWQVDAKLILTQFQQDIWAEQNRWLVLLVITNLVPTLLHFSLVCWGQFNGTFYASRIRPGHLLAKYNKAKASQNVKTTLNPSDYTWSQKEASVLAEYLCGLPIIWGGFVISLIIPFAYGIYGIYWLVTVGLAALVPLL